MIKERFKLDDEGEYIEDIKTGDLWDACGGGDGVPMLISKVNSLLYENEELKSFIKELCNENGEIWLSNGTIYRVRKKFNGKWVKE